MLCRFAAWTQYVAPRTRSLSLLSKLLRCFGVPERAPLISLMLEGGLRDWPLKVLLASAVTLPLLLQCFVSLRLSKKAAATDPLKKGEARPEEDSAPTKRYLYGSLAARVLLFLLPITNLVFWYELCFEQGLRGTFFRYRILSLSFPVSPIWPPLLATLGIFVVAVLHLRRLTWASRQRPILETSTLDQSLWGQLGKLNDALGRVFSGSRNQPARFPSGWCSHDSLRVRDDRSRVSGR